MFAYSWATKHKFIKVLLGASFVALIVINFVNSPLKDNPNRQLHRAQEVSKEIIKLSNGEKFNFALIAPSNYEAGYRYFLDMYGAPVVDIDPLDTKNTIRQNLFVVCEDLPEKCDPTHSPKAEVAAFGWSKIDQQWSLYGVTIYKLVHTQ